GGDLPVRGAVGAQLEDAGHGALLVLVGAGVTALALADAAVPVGVLPHGVPPRRGLGQHALAHPSPALPLLVLDDRADHLADERSGRVVGVVGVYLARGGGEHHA